MTPCCHPCPDPRNYDWGLHRWLVPSVEEAEALERWLQRLQKKENIERGRDKPCTPQS